MHRNNKEARTRSGRVSALALLAAIGLALGLVASAGAYAAEEPRLIGIVNVNTATAEQLQLLPGIGESRADAMIALRKKQGGFKSIDELTQVRGIGDVALEKLRPFVRVQGKTTARIE